MANTKDYVDLVDLLEFIRDSCDGDVDLVSWKVRELHDTFAKVRDNLEERDQRQAEEEVKRNQAVPIVVPDFSRVMPGTLVTRSPHYLKECFGRNKGQLGIITKVVMYKDDLNGASFWPDVHWVGEYSSTSTHPINVALADGTKLPTVTVNANQIEINF